MHFFSFPFSLIMRMTKLRKRGNYWESVIFYHVLLNFVGVWCIFLFLVLHFLFVSFLFSSFFSLISVLLLLLTIVLNFDGQVFREWNFATTIVSTWLGKSVSSEALKGDFSGLSRFVIILFHSTYSYNLWCLSKIKIFSATEW